MPANYPTSVWSPTTKNAGDTIQPAHINDAQTEIVAIEAGLTQGTAPLNSSHSTLVSLSVSGGSTLATLQVTGASTLASVVIPGLMTLNAIPYTMPSSGGSTGQVLTCTSTSGSTMALEWRTVTPSLVLVKANSGSDTGAVAVNLDTIAITGLTAKDRLLVYVTLSYLAQAGGEAYLYSTTDAAKLVSLSGGTTFAAGTYTLQTAWLGQDQIGATTIDGTSLGVYSGTGALLAAVLKSVPGTAWTSNFTLALRYDGMTAGGTLRWTWSVYKVAGQ